MNPQIERLFTAALDLPERDRAAFIERQEADPAVRREVLSLLLHESVAEPFLAQEIGAEISSAVGFHELREGTIVGSYRVRSLLGRGGMGMVYLAERADGSFEQQVALKVIQSPFPLTFLRERFQQARQILARLNHPNIARLLDGGQTAQGSPYLVMEYVAGQPLDEF